MDGFNASQRQVYWEAKSGKQYDKQMRQVAEYAVEVYGEMIEGNSSANGIKHIIAM